MTFIQERKANSVLGSTQLHNVFRIYDSISYMHFSQSGFGAVLAQPLQEITLFRLWILVVSGGDILMDKSLAHDAWQSQLGGGSLAPT